MRVRTPETTAHVSRHGCTYTPCRCIILQEQYCGAVDISGKGPRGVSARASDSVLIDGHRAQVTLGLSIGTAEALKESVSRRSVPEAVVHLCGRV